MLGNDNNPLDNQPLGSWTHDVYRAHEPNLGYQLSNAIVTEFVEKTGIGKDYSIITNYIDVDLPFSKISFVIGEHESIKVK